MSRVPLPVPVAEPTQIDGTAVQSADIPEQLFSSTIGDVARLLWPTKTAANVAALAGCSERAVSFYLAGEREWSGDAIAAVVSEILRRHAMRHVKVAAR